VDGAGTVRSVTDVQESPLKMAGPDFEWSQQQGSLLIDTGWVGNGFIK
jgi:hypothetical protein